MELEQKVENLLEQVILKNASIQSITGDQIKKVCIVTIEDAEFEIETTDEFLNWKIIKMKRNNKIWKHEKYFKKYLNQLKETMNQMHLILIDERNSDILFNEEKNQEKQKLKQDENLMQVEQFLESSEVFEDENQKIRTAEVNDLQQEEEVRKEFSTSQLNEVEEKQLKLTKETLVIKLDDQANLLSEKENQIKEEISPKIKQQACKTSKIKGQDLIRLIYLMIAFIAFILYKRRIKTKI